MTISEDSRHHLHNTLDDLLGPQDAGTLMAYLPPVGWSDVATRRDLDLLEARFAHRLEHELRLMTWRITVVIVTALSIAIAAPHF